MIKLNNESLKPHPAGSMQDAGCRCHASTGPHIFTPHAGDLTVQCASTGLFAALHFRGHDSAVRGVLEQHSGSGVEVVGEVEGSWREKLVVSTPKGLSGSLLDFDGLPGVPPMPLLPGLDLTRPGPLQLPRLWSVLLDSIIYNDKKLAHGGRVSKGYIMY